MGLAVKEKMAKRAAEEVKDGDIVNLGFGIPQKTLNYIDPKLKVFFHAENGILGAGPVAEKSKENPDLIDSGCVPITAVPGASYFDSADSFALIKKAGRGRRSQCRRPRARPG